MNEQLRLLSLCGLCSPSWGSFSSTKVRDPKVRLQGNPEAPLPHPEKPEVGGGNWQQREIALRGLLTFPSLPDLLKGSILKHSLRFSHFCVTRVASSYSVVTTCQALAVLPVSSFGGATTVLPHIWNCGARETRAQVAGLEYKPGPVCSTTQALSLHPVLPL